MHKSCVGGTEVPRHKGLQAGKHSGRRARGKQENLQAGPQAIGSTSRHTDRHTRKQIDLQAVRPRSRQVREDRHRPGTQAVALKAAWRYESFVA